MAINELIFASLEVIPLVRRALRWLLERNMEVTVKARFEDMGNPYIIRVREDGKSGGVYALLDLSLVNHRTDRPERIIECWAELRKRYLFFWHRTLAKIPVLTHSANLPDLDYPIKDIYLEPMGKPHTRVINIIGDFEAVQIPRQLELVLIFRMVGPMRKYTYRLTHVSHNPKRIADKEASETE